MLNSPSSQFIATIDGNQYQETFIRRSIFKLPARMRNTIDALTIKLPHHCNQCRGLREISSILLPLFEINSHSIAFIIEIGDVATNRHITTARMHSAYIVFVCIFEA